MSLNKWFCCMSVVAILKACTILPSGSIYSFRDVFIYGLNYITTRTEKHRFLKPVSTVSVGHFWTSCVNFWFCSHKSEQCTRNNTVHLWNVLSELMSDWLIFCESYYLFIFQFSLEALKEVKANNLRLWVREANCVLHKKSTSFFSSNYFFSAFIEYIAGERFWVNSPKDWIFLTTAM